ncbi:MAG: ABC transporter family substrate-binding protein [Acidimicrobiales bacterium]|nr:ABC transporter family substrate-binding protein [Acidimicrobiales bacterium]
MSFTLVAAACGSDDDGAASDDGVETGSDDSSDDSSGDDGSSDDSGDDSSDDGSGDDGGETEDDGLPLSDMNLQSRDSLQDGGELRFAISLFPGNWNGLNVDGNTVSLDRIDDFVMPNNWIYAEDASFDVDPDYVESFDVQDATADTGLVVTLNLNPDAIWNSGESIDWEDYEATWKACNGEQEDFNCASTDGYNQIASIEQGDSPFQVIVTFQSSYPDWSAVLSGVFPAEGLVDAATFNEGWAGNDNFNSDWHTGPFALESIDDAERVLTLTRNPNWWGEPALLDTVSFRELQNPADVQAFANGEVDVVETMIDSNSVSQAENRTDGAIRTAGSLQWRHFTFQSKSGNTQDLEVRQAIVKATNRVAIAQSDLAGLPVVPEQLLLGNHFFMPGQQGYVDNSGDFAYDPEAAMAQLDAAGWVLPEGSEVREKDGVPLEVNYAMLTGVATSENEGKLLQSDLANVGIQLNLVNTPTDDFVSTLVGGTFDIIAFTWQGTNYPMANVRQIYGAASEGSDEPSSSNFAQLIMPEVEALIPQIDTENDLQTRIDLTNQADKIIWDNVHTMPIYRRQSFTAVPENLANMGASTFQLTSLQVENIGYTN